jgi:Spy/CpxP family protein refolding chaperone
MKITLPKFLIATAMTAAMVFAQPMRTPQTPDQMAQRRVNMMSRWLSLSSDQQASAQTIFSNSETALQGIRTNMQTARQNLQTAIQSNDVNGIEAAATSIGNLTTQMTENQAKAEAAFYQVLTPDQRTKYAQMGHGRMGMGGGGMMGRGRWRQ